MVLGDEVLDVIAMVAISGAIGFHVILLPTFALEFLPMSDMCRHNRPSRF
jgi:hypothetical protein